MFKRLFTVSAFFSILLLSGCNVPFVPLIQNEQKDAINPEIEESIQAPLKDYQKVPSFYANTRKDTPEQIAKG